MIHAEHLASIRGKTFNTYFLDPLNGSGATGSRGYMKKYVTIKPCLFCGSNAYQCLGAYCMKSGSMPPCKLPLPTPIHNTQAGGSGACIPGLRYKKSSAGHLEARRASLKINLTSKNMRQQERSVRKRKKRNHYSKEEGKKKKKKKKRVRKEICIRLNFTIFLRMVNGNQYISTTTTTTAEYF